MTFLPTGKILSDWCWCKCVSRISPPRALLSRSMSLDGSNPGSLQKPLRAAHTDDCSIFLSLFELNDQRLGAGSVKSLCLHHGNAGVGSSCLESTLVPLELCVKLISVLTGMKMTNCLLPDSVLRKIRSVVLWFEPGNISGSFFSKIASSEHFSCSAHDGKSLQATKFLYADSQDLIHSPLIVFLLCSESSQGSQYASVNSYWPDLTMSICQPKLACSISRKCSASFPHLRLPMLKANSLLQLSFVDWFIQVSSRQGRERSFSTIEFLQQLHLWSKCVNFNPDLMSHIPVGKLERLSLIDLSFLEKFISTSSHRGWERSFSPFSSFMERHLPSLSSYTESLTTSTNRFEFYTQFELLTLLVMLQISFNNHIGLYRILHEAWQLKLCGLFILSTLISRLATKLAVCNANGAVKAMNYCRDFQV